MPTGLRFTVDTITPELKAARERAKNLKPALTLFGAKMILSIDENFRREGRRDGRGGAWEALSEATLAMRTAGREGSTGTPKILTDTGNLRSSTIQEASNRTMAVGSVVGYANDHHQDGEWGSSITKRETVTIKAHRRWVWVRPETTSTSARGKISTTPKGRRARPKTATERITARGVSVERRRRLKTIAFQRTLRGRLRRARRASGLAPAEGLVRRRMGVKRHTQNRVSVIPARPIYVFQPADLRQWSTIQTNWVMRGTLRKVA